MTSFKWFSIATPRRLKEKKLCHFFCKCQTELNLTFESTITCSKISVVSSEKHQFHLFLEFVDRRTQLLDLLNLTYCKINYTFLGPGGSHLVLLMNQLHHGSNNLVCLGFGTHLRITIEEKQNLYVYISALTANICYS